MKLKVIITQKGVEISCSAVHKNLWGAISSGKKKKKKHTRPNSASYVKEEA